MSRQSPTMPRRPEHAANPHARSPWWLTPRGVRTLWLLAGLAMLATLFAFPITRTQEARVLETAREMLESHDWRQWLVPRLNGDVRLQKPPLPYWLAAGSYVLFGVHEWSGRLPMALLAWLLLALTYRTAVRHGFGVRAAFFAAATLAGTYLFFRYSRLAETDLPAAFFATAATFLFWESFGDTGTDAGADARSSDPLALAARPASQPLSRRRTFALHHLAAAAIGLAILSKGPPAVFPVLFLLAHAAANRRWDVPRRFVLSGAPLTLLLVALPWFAYLELVGDTEVIEREMEKIAEGSGHAEPLYMHLVYLLKATAPWVAFTILSLVVAVPRWRTDPRLRALLVWAGVILLPLSLIGQKQEHYLVPILPPLMILTGWVIDLALSGADEKLTRFATLLLKGTVVAGFLGAIGIVVGAKLERQALHAGDFLLAGAVLLAMTVATIAYHRRGLAAGFAAACAAWFLTIAGTVGLWEPQLDRPTYSDFARALRQHAGPGPYAFHPIPSMVLVFDLRQIIPVLETREELAEALRREPNLTVIFERKPKRRDEPPGGLTKLFEMPIEEKVLGAYRLAAPTTQPSGATTRPTP